VAFQGGAILLWLKNSAVYSLGALVITLAATIPAGYGLALTRFRGRRALLSLTLVVMLVPTAALVLPIYLELSAVHLTGTAWSVILPFSFYPFGVYLTYIYYSTSLPRDLLAAARIDGCTEWQIFLQIALPLARPVVGLVAFFSFVGNWNNYFLPFVMLANSQDYPVQIGLQQLLSSTPALNPGQGGAELNIQRPELALAIIIGILPVLVLFLFSQRTLVAGLLAGSTKE
jgi:multiple sugar transport system permease protein